MASPPAFLLSEDVIAGLFKHVKSWKEVYSLSLVSKQFYHVGQQQQISVPFIINTEVNIYEIPCQMAQILTVNCNILAEEASINRIIDSFVNCVQININFNDLSSLTIIRKICKIIVKKGISLRALSSYDQEKVEFLLRDSSCFDSSASSSNYSDTTFTKVTNINKYRAVIPTTNLFSIGFEEALPQLQQFVNRIINFNSFGILVTSLDVCHRNYRNLDDCDFSSYNIEQTLVAKIHSRTYTNKSFVELFIHAGHYGLLVIGGYIRLNGLPHSFLGSSLEKIKFNDEITVIITLR